MVSLSRPYHFKSFKGCLPQILLGPFLNTLSHFSILAEATSVGNNRMGDLHIDFRLEMLWKIVPLKFKEH